MKKPGLSVEVDAVMTSTAVVICCVVVFEYIVVLFMMSLRFYLTVLMLPGVLIV